MKWTFWWKILKESVTDARKSNIAPQAK